MIWIKAANQRTWITIPPAAPIAGRHRVRFAASRRPPVRPALFLTLAAASLALIACSKTAKDEAASASADVSAAAVHAGAATEAAASDTARAADSAADSARAAADTAARKAHAAADAAAKTP
jgi:hypothetical protein